MAAKSSKILLMGRAGAGKTSMKSIIFANVQARESRGIQQTNWVSESKHLFMGNMSLNLWDCGGQDTFMENYFESQRETIFSNSSVLIYVIVADPVRRPSNMARGPHEGSKEMQYYTAAVQALKQFSPGARVFCLIHKMDLVHESKREELISNYRRDLLNASQGLDVQCFGTSIWDETLYKAWSEIVQLLIPRVDELARQIEHLCEVCFADEMVLFERSTFLLICFTARRKVPDEHRFERISNIAKQFKLSCNKASTMFRTFQIKKSNVTATIEPFLQHSLIMTVVSDPDIQVAATCANLNAAREHYANLSKDLEYGIHM